MAQTNCSMPTCETTAIARGWCMKHYQRWYKHGDPLVCNTPDRREVCTVDGCSRKHRAKGLCSSHYNAQHPNRKAWKKNGNPEKRRANLRRKTQQRRARLKGDLSAALIDRDEIGERDEWKCGLCHLNVSRDLSYPHPRSASLDHIEPLSLGGKHVRENVQIAHLDCNVAKGNRGGGEQLLLIG